MEKEINDNTGKKIRHLVIFDFKDGINFHEKDKFLQDSKSVLTSIEGVENFEILKQINPDIKYPFGFSMEFKNKEIYELYKKNPIHLDYVKQRWEKAIDKFLGLDFEEYS